jgi:radical SAM protein with 4Fe4S-binding SPASM domain
MIEPITLFDGSLIAPYTRGVPLPRKLTIETFGGCNLRCPLCPTGQGLRGRPMGPMKMEIFSEIMRQLGDVVETIDFFNWSEPLLNRNLPTMIRMARERNIHTVVSSNLNIVPDPEALVRSGLNELLVSCDAITPETYVKYRVGGNFHTVMKNLEKILAIRHLNPELVVKWRFITFAHNEHEIPAVLARCQELGVVPDVNPNRLDMRQEILLQETDRIAQYQTWIPDNSPVYDKVTLQKKIRFPACPRPWYEAVIDVDGSVTFCCSSYDKEYDIGNIMETPFVDIWNGQIYQASREYISRGTSSFNLRTICHICKDNGYQDF